MQDFSELLQKLRDSVPQLSFPGICSSIEKVVQSLCLVIRCKQKTACYLEDTDSEEENIGKSVVQRAACDRSSSTFLPSYEETSYFMNSFHQMPHVPILDSTCQCSLLDICSKHFLDMHNIHPMVLPEDDIYQDFSNDSSETFEHFIAKEIESLRQEIDFPETPLVDIIKFIQEDLYSLISEGMSNVHTNCII